jgi:PAS domain S-box-containing protein
MSMRFDIEDEAIKERLAGLTESLGESDLIIRTYPHANSFPPSHGSVVALLLTPEAADQAVAEGVQDLLPINLSDESLLQRLQRAANSSADDASRDLESLQQLIRTMATSRDPSVILRRMSKALAERIEFNRSSILLFNLEEGRAQVITATDRGDDNDAPIHLEVGKYPELTRLIQTRNTVVINDTSIDPLLDAVRADVTGAGVGAAVLFPLIFEGDLIGCVFLRRSAGLSGPRAEALRFGEIVAGACATALHTARLLRNARHRQVVATRARLLAESKLKDYERFEEFFAYASDGMAVLDSEGRFLAINPEGRRILGFTEEELRERPIAQVVVAQDQMVIARVVRGFGHRIFPRNLQVRVLNGRGQERTISISAGGLGGQSSGVIASFRDVTEATMLQRELTATKEFLENLVNRTGDGIISARLDGQVILFNSAAEEIFGISAREVLYKPRTAELFAHNGWQELIEELRASDGVLTGAQRIMRHKSNREVIVRLGASLLFEDNEEAAVVLLIHDLSQEMALRAEIDQQTAQAGEVQGALLMAATAAHELNQPLTAILGFADMAMQQLEPEHRSRAALKRITEAAERLADRVRELGRLKRIVTRSYGDGAEIVDLEASTRTQVPSAGTDLTGIPDEITQTSFRITGPTPTLDPESTS